MCLLSAILSAIFREINLFENMNQHMKKLLTTDKRSPPNIHFSLRDKPPPRLKTTTFVLLTLTSISYSVQNSTRVFN